MDSAPTFLVPMAVPGIPFGWHQGWDRHYVSRGEEYEVSSTRPQMFFRPVEGIDLGRDQSGEIAWYQIAWLVLAPNSAHATIANCPPKTELLVVMYFRHCDLPSIFRGVYVVGFLSVSESVAKPHTDTLIVRFVSTFAIIICRLYAMSHCVK
jgi:hypothetical protein